MKQNRSIFGRTTVIAIIGIVISILLLSNFHSTINFLINLLEENIASDHQIDPTKKDNLIGAFIFFILLLSLFSIDILFNIHTKLILAFRQIIKFDDLSKFYLTDNLCRKKNLSHFILIIGTIFGLLIYFIYLLIGVPVMEGVIETSCTSLLIFAVLILIISGIKFRLSFDIEERRLFLLIIFSISLLFLLLFGEEISWGQCFLKWKSTGIFEEYNFQKETNMHNFLNPVFKFIYPIAGISFFLVLFLTWFFSEKKKLFLIDLFTPHPSLFSLALLMACTSFMLNGEIFEDQLELLTLLYSIRIFMCLNFPSKSFQKSISKAE